MLDGQSCVYANEHAQWFFRIAELPDPVGPFMNAEMAKAAQTEVSNWISSQKLQSNEIPVAKDYAA